MKNISLLGATGSIGQQTLEVINEHAEELKLVAMSIGDNLELGRQIIREFSPELVSVKTKDACEKFKSEFSSNVRFVYGNPGLIEVATYKNANILLNAVVGSVGLMPTLQAIESGKTICLANKETLVTAGHLVMNAAKRHNVPILPVDSEHSAIFQCLQGEKEKNVEKIILTASGGSFRDKSREELKDVTVDDALKHPNWSMGAKITIDSATMMNKGLEVIEAHWLFEMPYEKIEVLLHKESIIHSMVEFQDSSVMAQLGTPDMKVPIQYAFSYPDRYMVPASKERLKLGDIGKLHFSNVDFLRFKCLDFAYHAGKKGGSTPTVLNAANEEAVAGFLKGKIPFLKIEELIEAALEMHTTIKEPNLEEIREVDEEARAFVGSLLP